MRTTEVERELRLTAREVVLFAALRKKKKVSINELVEALAEEEMIGGGFERNTLIVAMKYLAAKVAVGGWIIERTSGIGRGHNAEYSMTKRF